MSQLPVELWWNILHLAVDDPELFETKWDHPFNFYLREGWDNFAFLRSKTLATKSSICQVSKSWREIGVQLLYAHLSFTENSALRFGAIPKLLSIFEQHAAQPGYGRSTKRVDIWSEPDDQSWIPSLLNLLELCHNIRIFTVTADSLSVENQAELSSLFQSRFSHSLRRVKFESDSLYYIPNVPLKTFELFTYSFPPDPPPAISTVTNLSLEDEGGMLSWRFPALQHLNLRDVSNDFTVSLQSFMTTHGPQLYSLHLVVDHYSYDDRVTLVPKLLALATNLRCLTLPFSGEVDWSPAINSFPSITDIGFYSFHYRDAPEIELLISGSLFPRLECIRFSSFIILRDDDVGPNDITALMSFLEAGVKRNIRIEDAKCSFETFVSDFVAYYKMQNCDRTVPE